MAIFVIGDLHLSLGADKPMDKFPGWQGYVQRIRDNWLRCVGRQDTVVLAGDTSWGMKLEEAAPDFAFLQALPGKKLLLKGNHDYWWTTARKMETFFQANGFTSLALLHNNAHLVEGCAVCGTRSWMFEPDEPHDEKVMARELGRLEMSLAAAGGGPEEKLVFLHYPPVYPGASAPQVVEVLHRFGVKRCFYGHLHGAATRAAVQGVVDGVEYRLVSADSLRFCPYKIEPGYSFLNAPVI